jgi:FG-GAP-like repeat
MFRVAAATLLGALALASVIDTLVVGARAQSLASPPRSASPRLSAGEPTEAEVRSVCTPCHAFAPPDVLPRAAWRDEIARMSLIRDNRPQPAGPAGTAARLIPLPPDFERALRYFEAHAPDRLPPPSEWPAADRMAFATRGLSTSGAATAAAIANVRLADVDGDRRLELLAADMRSGLVTISRPYAGDSTMTPLAELSNPAHISMVDFDQDGTRDFFVADLGQFLPSDHDKGAVVLLRGRGALKYDTLALDGWPRVADVETGDFNGDGTLDVLVAAFGWRKTGRLVLLENHTVDYSKPSFVPRMIDDRPGAIHAIPTDLNGDGQLDLIAVFAQQFESVVAYINAGTAPLTFTQNIIYTAPHPNWGSSGIEVVDGDGDLDVLLTHGDTFDDEIIKPYHGIQWLENIGAFPFAAHTLADLPGVSRAQAADLDGDGDLDVIASTFIALGADVDEKSLPSLVWLEQKRNGVFERHTLEVGNPRHATLDAADFDRDGDVDIVVGNFNVANGSSGRDAVEIWENRRIFDEQSTR